MKNEEVINNLENLRIIRESRNITQTNLATALGVTQELISRYELGTAFPQPNRLIELANFFNCSVDYLLGITDDFRPIELLTEENKLTEQTKLFTKYSSLSKEDQSTVDKFIEFLLNNKSN